MSIALCNCKHKSMILGFEKCHLFTWNKVELSFLDWNNYKRQLYTLTEFMNIILSGQWFLLRTGVRASELCAWYFCKLNPLTHRQTHTNPTTQPWRMMLPHLSHCHRKENMSCSAGHQKVHDPLLSQCYTLRYVSQLHITQPRQCMRQD